MTRIPPLRLLTPEVTGAAAALPGPAQPPAAQPAAPAAAPAVAPKAASDALAVSGTRPLAAMQDQLSSVQSGLSAPTMSPAEIRRLLNGPRTLSKVAGLIEREPRLAQNFARPGGGEILNLLRSASVRPLKEAEVKTLQRYLIGDGARIAYKGHSTGVDGDYGKLTHNALVNLLAKPLPAQPEAPAKPAEQPIDQAPAKPVEKPAQPTLEEIPEAPADPEAEDTVPTATLLARLSEPGQSLAQMAATIQRLPDGERDKLLSLSKNGARLGSLLAEAAARPLNKTELKALQGLLVEAGQSLKYPGHATGIDGNFGERSRQALAKVVTGLVSGKDPASLQPYPQYERMLSDGLLDMTVAVGFDEATAQYAGAHHAEEKKVLEGLASRGFVRNDAKARELLQAAGNESKADYAALYVKENIDSHDGKPVHAVVRVILAGDGDKGAANRQAAIEAMSQSDVFAYGGHGRYGNGPDFDRNFKVTVDWNGVANAPAEGKVVYEDYYALKDLLGKSDAAAISRLRELEAQGRVTIDASNDGNIRMSESNPHAWEFGAQLMDRALKGVSNTLSDEIKGNKYKLWLFEACRTRDYVTPIRQEARSNTGLNSNNLDLFTTEQMMYWQNTGTSLLTLLDGVAAKESASDLVARLRSANPEQAAAPTHSRHGFEDNQYK